MAQLRNESTDSTARTDTPDTPFYLPGMPGPSVGSGRVARYFVNLFRRRGVLPADFLRQR